MGIMTVWTLLVPAALFSSAPACYSRWRPAARWNPRSLAGTAGALVGGLQKYRLRRPGLALGDDAADRSKQPGAIDDANGTADSTVLATAGFTRFSRRPAAGLSAAISPDSGLRLIPGVRFASGKIIAPGFVASE